VTAVARANTTVSDIEGVGSVVACYLIGHSGDIGRFPTAGQHARYSGTTPIEASSGPRVRHWLNPNGKRQLNHAIHIAALGQISHDTSGRAYYLAKQAAGKSRKEATRCPQRRISDAIYQRLRANRRHLRQTGPGKTLRATLGCGRQIPERRHFGSHSRTQHAGYDHEHRSCHRRNDPRSNTGKSAP
jgi:hypothetical protein